MFPQPILSATISKSIFARIAPETRILKFDAGKTAARPGPGVIKPARFPLLVAAGRDFK